MPGQLWGMDRVKAPASPETSTSSQGREGARWEGPAVPSLEEVHTEGQGALEGAEPGARLGRSCCLRGGEGGLWEDGWKGRPGPGWKLRMPAWGVWTCVCRGCGPARALGRRESPHSPSLMEAGALLLTALALGCSAGPTAASKLRVKVVPSSRGGRAGAPVRLASASGRAAEAEGGRCGPGEGAVGRRLQHQCTWAPWRSRPAPHLRNSCLSGLDGGEQPSGDPA